MAVTIKDLSKSFGPNVVFKDFSLRMPDQGCICLFGPSGSGKTTLLNLIAGSVLPDTGSVSLPSGNVSVVFQEDRLLPWADALHNVQLVLEKSLPSKKAQEKALYFLKEVFLEDTADKYPAELSGGMRRRVALARALAFGGSVLLLDEPFSGLDAQIKEALFLKFSQIKKEKLIVLVTHYPEEAVRLADTIHILGGPPVCIEKTIPVSKALRESENASRALARELTLQLPPDTQE